MEKGIMNPILYKTTEELRALYLKKELSPVDVIDLMIKRIDQTNPLYNFVTSWDPEKNRKLAKQAEQLYQKGGEIPYLTGIPITIKDIVAVKDEPFTSGSYAFKNNIAKESDVLAQRLLDQGGINIAKTTLPEFCHKMLTDCPLFGYTKSPYNVEYSPGGSSGGAAVALIVGAGTMAVGSDGGGSIRCPSACSNLVGIKPTLGSIPDEHGPDVFNAYPMKGPMARTVIDCATMFAITAGTFSMTAQKLEGDLFNQFEPDFSIATALSLKGSVKGLKVAYIEKFRKEPIDSDVSRLCRKAVENMQQQGAIVENVSGDIFNDVGDFYVLIHTTGHATHLGKFVKDYAEHMSLSLLDCIAEGKTFTAVEHQEAMDQRTVLWRNVQKLLKQYDVIISPTLTSPMQKLEAGGAMNTELFKKWCPYTYPFNLTGNPALSVPVGLSSEGFPVGLQIVGPWHSEKRLFEVAKFLEDTQPWSHLYPIIS